MLFPSLWRGQEWKATKSKGSEVPEHVTPSPSINSMVVFCTSPWKCHSLGGFLVPFPLSFCCLLPVRHPCFCSCAADKTYSRLFLLSSEKTPREREERGIDEGCPQSCRCTCRGESLVKADTALVVLRASICTHSSRTKCRTRGTANTQAVGNVRRKGAPLRSFILLSLMQALGHSWSPILRCGLLRGSSSVGYGGPGMVMGVLSGTVGVGEHRRGLRHKGRSEPPSNRRDP